MKMKSRERIIAAMRGQDVDRVPLCPRMSHPLRQRFGIYSANSFLRFQKEYFDMDPEYCYEHPLENPVQDVFCVKYLRDSEAALSYKDNGDSYTITRRIKTPAGDLQDVSLIPKPEATAYGPTANAHKFEHLIKEPADLAKIDFILPEPGAGNLAAFFQEDYIMGENGLVNLNIPGPMDYWGGEAIHQENMMISYYENRDFFDAVVAYFGGRSIAMVRDAVEKGVKNFFLANYYVSMSAGWSPEIIRDSFIPTVRSQVELIHAAGGLATYYDDGKIMQTVEIIAGSGVDVIETCAPPPVGDFNLAYARQKLGNRVTFKGGIDMINVIAKGTPAEIEVSVRDFLAANGGNTHLILGTMDSIRPETSVENLAAYFNSANKYR
jgi:uroporphyrinogen-III decarboxylase